MRENIALFMPVIILLLTQIFQIWTNATKRRELANNQQKLLCNINDFVESKRITDLAMIKIQLVDYYLRVIATDYKPCHWSVSAYDSLYESYMRLGGNGNVKILHDWYLETMKEYRLHETDDEPE